MDGNKDSEELSSLNKTTTSDNDFSAILSRLRAELLDLSARNRLVNFRYTRQSLRFVGASLDGPYKSLLDGKGLQLRYVPLPSDEEVDEHISAKDYATRIALPTSYELEYSNASADYLQTLIYPKELDRTIRVINAENQLTLDESGNHILFLVCGFLSYKPSEGDNSSEHIAPLLLLPINLQRGGVDPISGLYTYFLSALDEEEEVRDNITLREKLNHDFGFQLPVYKEHESPSSYLAAVSDACGKRKGWRVLPHLSLALLSFKKIALWADLDIEQDQMLIHHPLMRKLFGVDEQLSNNESLAEEYLVDDHPGAELPFIYNADSSQHSALIDALEGKNLVIVGPPGTGKSQTITNLIAAAIGRGKSVLFISEKKAALDVVSKRIEDAGLAPFCLELHSNKSCKKVVLGSLEQRMHQTFRAVKTINDDLSSLKKMRQHLNSYTLLMNRVIDMPGELTLHDILWRVEKVRQSLAGTAEILRSLWWSDAMGWKTEDLRLRRQLLGDLALHYDQLGYAVSSHPLCGITIKTFSPIDKHQIEQAFQEGIAATKGLLETYIILWGDKEGAFFSADQWALWQMRLKQIAPIAGNRIDLIKDFENIISEASPSAIQDALKLIRAFFPTLIESNKLLSSKVIAKDFSLAQSPIDDIPIARLATIAQDFISALSQGEGFLPFSSLANLEKLVTWLCHDERHWLLELSLERVQSLREKLSVLLDGQAFEATKGDDKTRSYVEIAKIIEEAEKWTEQLISPMESLVNLQQECGLKEMTASSFDLLMVCDEIFASAPPNFSSIWASRIDFGDGKALTETLTEGKALLEDQKELARCFYLNMVPMTYALDDCLKTIRKAGWYSFASRRVLRAKKLFRSLFREATSVDVSSPQVERLFLWCQRRDNFLKDPARRRLFSECFVGGCFRVKEQDQADLEALSNWWDEACHRLKNVPGGHEIDLFMISSDTIHRLKTSKVYVIDAILINRRLQSHLSILEPYYRELEALIVLAETVVSETIPFNVIITSHQGLMTCCSELCMLGQSVDRDISWSDLRSLMSVQLGHIERILERCQPLAPSSLTQRQIKSALNAHQRVVDLVACSQNDRLLALLITSVDSLDFKRLEVLEKTFAWVLAVKQSCIPSSVEKRLFAQPMELEHLCDVLQNGLLYAQQWKEAIVKLQKLCSVDQVLWSLPAEEITPSETHAAKHQFERALSSLDNIDGWIAYNNCRDIGMSLDLSSLIHNLESGLLTVGQLNDAFEYVYHRSCIHNLYKQFPDLSRETGPALDGVRQRFSELDSRIIRINGTRLATDIAKRQIPEGYRAAKASEQTELVLLKHEIAKTSRHLPIRKLMKQAGRAIQALKPCFLMSPLSVAQYLPKSALTFDLLVIDEASQMRLPEAFGAILRSKQIVVVGDPKQLPPSNFFEQTTNDDEEGENLGAIEDGVQSILERCLQIFKTPRHLRWHYRSQHQNLIAFSNHHFYDNRLVVLPSCRSADTRNGVYYNYISDSVYMNRMNQNEAEKLVDALVSQLLGDSVTTVGVVTLNQPQRDLICELFTQKLQEIPLLREVVDRFEACGQSVFIKNLENVQGDERDIVFISTVYGKAPGSCVVRQTFGPINGSSGWRRLNVLFTRARQRIELYSSMQPEDIIVNEEASLGLRTLKHYLEFARRCQESGQRCQLSLMNPSRGEAENPFEEAIVDFLQRNGYEVHPQLGVQGYWIDIAVRHPEKPGEYLAAIECDGATYHSSRSARDRDRIRQELLEALGWKGKIFRIWSTDWFTNPHKQCERLLGFLASLRFPNPIEG